MAFRTSGLARPCILDSTGGKADFILPIHVNVQLIKNLTDDSGQLCFITSGKYMCTFQVRKGATKTFGDLIVVVVVGLDE
jgi:hypothetical protein